ncbi:MAG: hypothetical protein VKI83_09575 [Synechococcaceae cyanobacterium]|nr:hypothetical protein [Synechococcaceae cyanobacterium]
MSPVRAIPKSRAYWELKAEQVMNRVFAPEPSIEVEIVDGPQATPAPASPAAPAKPPTPVARHQQVPRPAAPARPAAAAKRPLHQNENPPQLLLAGFGVLALALAGGTVAGLSFWNQNQQSLRQERNLLMIERLRSLAPGDAAPAQSQAPLAEGQGANGTGPELPPPPPDEPWMQELSSLPQSSAPPARVLQVPMNDRVAAPAPAASGGSASRAGAARSGGAGGAGSLPQLVGVIQIPGRSGSAIFQLNGSSTSAAVGDSIGSSGWRLRSAEGDSAVIERGGDQRRVTISSGS